MKWLQVPPIYVLDCSNVNEWNDKVYEPAVAIIEAALKGEEPTQKSINELVTEEKRTDSSNEENRYCEVNFSMRSFFINVDL